MAIETAIGTTIYAFVLGKKVQMLPNSFMWAKK